MALKYYEISVDLQIVVMAHTSLDALRKAAEIGSRMELVELSAELEAVSIMSVIEDKEEDS